MSLGSVLRPHLPFLRRFARALVSDASEGDRLVRAALEAIVADPDAFPQDVEPRLGLYRLFLDVVARQATEGAQATAISSSQSRGLSSHERRALLLTNIEGFTAREVAFLLGGDEQGVEALLRSALAAIGRRERARILIVEDEPIIAMDLETTVHEMGHEVVAVATTFDEAIEAAREDRPHLILADIQLRGNRSGMEAVTEIKRVLKTSIIFVTAFPERLLAEGRLEPTFLITKPFQRETIKAAISQALLFGEAGAGEPIQDGADAPDERRKPADEDAVTVRALASRSSAIRALKSADLSPRHGPLSAEVIEGRLVSGRGAPATSLTSAENVEAVRLLHLETADRLVAAFEGHNATSALRGRIEAARRTLARPFNEASGTALGVQAEGLARVLPAARELLMEHVAADVEAFASDLGELAWQFPLFREFADNARQNPALSADQIEALAAVARGIEAEPDEAVEPELKQELADIRQVAEQTGDVIGQHGLLSGVSNLLRAIGRVLHARAKSVGAQATKTFDEETGRLIGGLLNRLVVGGGLLGLAALLPAEFRIIPIILAAANVLKPGK